MARQLLQDRTPAAYAGVEAYARTHSSEDAGSLAWLVAGYAHILDHEYAASVSPLNRAKVHAGDLGDYVSFYLATAYFESGQAAEASPHYAQARQIADSIQKETKADGIVSRSDLAPIFALKTP